MSEFDIDQFEAKLSTLVDTHEQLKASYRSLQTELQAEQRKNEQTRQRLGQLIERIRALEAQAAETDSG
ncbi:hypothetical protein HKX42_08815 [Salinisphaera sp. USBA-960]|uniref:hypothetical protein n=1 Tax=Salinisphaera orenii TaxID=856731 RepID=UPI000DBE82E0|nr:hypothetical protein [Salifodinibacter halophilus]NNC26974.1 hypothetical protein [Salifodinibacter halophilus]